MIPEHELRKMYHDDQMTQKEIAKVFGVSKTSISKWMKQHDIKARTRSESRLGRLHQTNPLKPSKENLEKMYLNMKMSQTETGYEIGVSKATITTWMRLYGIESRTISESKLNLLKPPKENLEGMYWNENMSTREIGNEIGVDQATILNWMRSYGIKSRVLSDFYGENNSQWNGGTSFEPYCKKFNNKFKEAVRERDSHTCQLCGFEQNGRKLSVHHIHYDKSNCWPDVVALCISCNIKVNTNRDHWEKYFEDQLVIRGLLNWSTLQET